MRLRIVRSDDGQFWIQVRGDGPRLLLPASAGSQRWIRELVNGAPGLLNDAIRAAMHVLSDEDIMWRSPLAADGFCEYRDGEALERVDAPTLKVPLGDFWPERGPVWDGLARTTSGAMLFVEAKAHIRELASPGSRATRASLDRIEKALGATGDLLAPASRSAWSGAFYRYANRLAYLYFLRQRNALDAHLVFVNFVGATDVGGPTSPEAWDAAYIILHAALGLPEHHALSRFVHHVSIDVRSIVPAEDL